jgi:peptidoglycan/LPS O-acetylase OafA/YrhL
MLNDALNWLRPYLTLFGDSAWLQAAIVVLASFMLAWIFDRFISAALRKLVARTRFQFDDDLIDHLHNPIFTSVILAGLALAVNLLKIEEPLPTLSGRYF